MTVVVNGTIALELSTGSGVAINSGTIENTGVLSVAGRSGAVSLSTADVSGLGSLATQNIPAAGLIESNGTILSDVTFSNGITLSGGTLSPSWQGPPVTTVGTDLVVTNGTISGAGTLTGAVTVSGGNTALSISAAVTILPEYFGAAGNGVTDDTAAINAALASSATVVLLQKVYLCSGNIIVPAGKTLQGVFWPNVPSLLGYNTQPGSIQLGNTSSITLGTGSALKNVLVMNNSINVTMTSGSYNTAMYRSNLNVIAAMAASAQTAVVLDNTNDATVQNCMILGYGLGLSMNFAVRYNIDSVYIDCNVGWKVTQSYDNGQISRTRVHSFLTWGGFPPLVYDITALANSSGLVELTVVQDPTNTLQPLAVQNGDWVNVTGITGLATSINQLWTVGNVNLTAGTFTLTGSAYAAGAVITNGKVVINPYRRLGQGAIIEGTTGVNLFAPWFFGHDIGLYIGDYATGKNSAWINVSQIGMDNLGSTADPATIGLWLDGNTEWVNVGVGSFSSQGTAIKHTSSGDVNTFSNCMVAKNASTSPLIDIEDGSVLITTSKLNSGSYINIGTAAAKVILTGNDGTGTAITYANQAVISNVFVDPSQQFSSGQYASYSVGSSSGPTTLSLTDIDGVAQWELQANTNGTLSLFNKTAGTTPMFVNGAGFNVTELLYASAGVTAHNTNSVSMYGNVTGQSPYIQASGSDTNVSLGILAKGTGTVNVTSPLSVSTTATVNGGLSVGGNFDASGNVTISGALSGQGASFANLEAYGSTFFANSPSPTIIQSPYNSGLGIFWDVSAGTGEVDFVSYPQGGTGGFRFYVQPTVGGAVYLGGFDHLGNATVVGGLSAASASVSGALAGNTADFTGNVSVGGALTGTTADFTGAATIGGAVTVTGGLSGSSASFSAYVHAQNVLYGQTVYSSGPVTLTASQAGQYIYTINSAPMSITLPLSTDFTQVGQGVFFIGNSGSANVTVSLTSGDTNNGVPNGGVIPPGMSVLVGSNPGSNGWNLLASSLLSSLLVSGNVTVGGALSTDTLAVTVDPGLVPNVVSYGADPTGTHDSSAAFNAAASHGRVVVPPGVFLLDNTVTVPVGAQVIGSGSSSVINIGFAGAAFTITNASSTAQFSSFSDLTIIGTVSGATGISATYADFVDVQRCRFEGCNSQSVIFENCSYGSIEDNQIISSSLFAGGSVVAYATSASAVGRFILIARNRFSALPNGAFGLVTPCIQVQNVETAKIIENTLDWGAYGAGGVAFINVLDQCQDVNIKDNSALGVVTGIFVSPTATYNVMPSYLNIEGNAFDSFSTGGILINANATTPGAVYTISDNQITEPQAYCTAASPVGGSSGASYVVGDVLHGPVPPTGQEGAQVILEVSSIGSGGAVTGVTIYNAGLTQTPPTNPVSFTGGSGTGFQADLTFSGAGACLQLEHVSQVSGSDNYFASYANPVGTGVNFITASQVMLRGSIFSNLASAMWFVDSGSSDIRLSPDTIFRSVTNAITGTPPANFYSLPVRGQIYDFQQNTSITTTTPVTITGAQLVGNSLISRSGPGSAFTDTTDTAANIIAAFPIDGQVPPMSNSLRLQNYSAYPWTIQAGTGVTIGGAATIPSGMFVDVLVQISGSASVNLDIIGTGAIGNPVNIGTAAFTGGAINVSGNATVGGAMTVTGALSAQGGATVAGAFAWQGSVTGVPSGLTSPTVVSGTWYQNTTGGPMWIAVNASYASGAGATLYTASTSGGTGYLMDAYTNSGNTKEDVLNGLVPTGWWWVFTATSGVVIAPSGNPNGAYRVM